MQRLSKQTAMLQSQAADRTGSACCGLALDSGGGVEPA